MSPMLRLPIVAATVAVLLPAAAQAQYYGPAGPGAPLYPYAVQPGQAYAVEVAPNTYVIQRPAPTRAYPYVRCTGADCGRPAREPGVVQVPPRAPAGERPVKRNDRALIEELRQRHAAKKVTRDVVNTKKIVYDKPVVIETKRIVDDPPRIIERRHYVDENGVVTSEPAPAQPRARRGKKTAAVIEAPAAAKPAARADKKRADDSKKDTKKRVIEADAEVTILGPDRMSIRLFRKGGRGAGANASVE